MYNCSGEGWCFGRVKSKEMKRVAEEMSQEKMTEMVENMKVVMVVKCSTVL